ncbi:MAG: nickel-binding protein [Gaiellaceae bacterium]
MPRYLIYRKFTVGESEMPTVGRRSKELTVDQFPEIVWDHSHVVVDDDGVVYTYCVYEAPNEEMVREHAIALGKHEYTIHEIAGDVSPADFPLDHEELVG